jgi:hypothetical protein
MLYHLRIAWQMILMNAQEEQDGRSFSQPVGGILNPIGDIFTRSVFIETVISDQQKG